MKSLQHVLWRGALALGLMAAGVGTGVGMPPVEQAASPDICPNARTLAADGLPAAPARAPGTTMIVLRRPATPAG